MGVEHAMSVCMHEPVLHSDAQELIQSPLADVIPTFGRGRECVVSVRGCVCGECARVCVCGECIVCRVMLP